MPNLIEGIQSEMNRCRELLEAYKEIGSAGVFGAAMIKQAIKEGEDAIASGDVTRMVSACKALQESQ